MAAFIGSNMFYRHPYVPACWGASSGGLQALHGRPTQSHLLVIMLEHNLWKCLLLIYTTLIISHHMSINIFFFFFDSGSSQDRNIFCGMWHWHHYPSLREKCICILPWGKCNGSAYYEELAHILCLLSPGEYSQLDP